MPQPSPKVLIVIPAFNEEKSIGAAVDKIHGLYPDFDLVIINDGSTDGTSTVAKALGVRTVNLIRNLGIGGAVQTGFLLAQKYGYEFIVQYDGDNQHPAERIGALIETLKITGADIAIGSRFIEKEGFKTTLLRMPGIFILSRLISFITASHTTDPTSGFRAFGLRAIHLFAMEYPQNYPEPECLILASRHGLKTVEVPVVMNKRTEGASSIGFLTGLHYMFTVVVNILLRYLGTPQNRKDPLC